MSFTSMQQYARDDHRAQVLLKAHLEAGQWKSEGWALADSLAWALEALNRLTGKDVQWPDQDGAEYRLAQNRLTRVREAIK